MSVKRYDKSYFDRWYRDPRTRMWPRAAVARKVRMVLGVAEQILGRPVRSVLDVGCGEGTWQPILAGLRPRLRYVGVDSSEYAVRRHGRARNIRLGQFGQLEALALRGPFDLVVSCDVMHYLKTPELKRGLRAINELALGPAYLEAYASDDDIEGDDHDYQPRSAATWRMLIAAAGFVPVGMHCYVTDAVASELTALELS